MKDKQQISATLCLILAALVSPAPLEASIRGLAGYFSANDAFQHAIAGDSDGRIHEVFFNPAVGVFQDVLACFSQVKAVTGFYTPDDQLQHVIVATADGTVTEVYFNSTHPAAESTLGQFNGLVDIGGFYTADDGYRHVIVGTTNGDVTEIFYKPSTGIFQDVIGHYNTGLVALDGFYTSDDHYRHVIVATEDGNVHELFFNPQGGNGNAILANYSGIVDVAGFYSSDDNYRHAIVATSNGNIHEIFYNPANGSGQSLLSNYGGIVRIAAYFTPTDNYRHVIVTTANGNVYEVFYNPQAGLGSDTLATFQPLPPTLELIGPDTPTGSVNDNGAAGSAGQPIALAGDPANCYVVTLNAGGWQSVNGGPWAQLAQSPRYAMCAAVNPTDSARLAVGERDGDATDLRQNTTGVWESADRGNTWTHTLDPLGTGCASAAISSLAFSSQGTLFVATSCGIGRKPAGDGSFDFSHSPPSIGWVSAVVASESRIWARTPSSLLVSTNDGLSWAVKFFPQTLNGLTINFPSRGDLFSLGAFDVGAFLPCANDPTAPCGNMNRLLIYNWAQDAWLLQPRLDSGGNPALGCDGTGLGGRRFVRSFVLNRQDLQPVIGQRHQLFVGVGQEIYQANGQNPDGTISSWARIAATREAGGTVDPLHPDIWDFLLAPDASRAWQANDGGVSSKSWPAGGWQTYNQSLSTLYLNMLTLLPQSHVKPSRIAFPTPDNDAWFYDSGLGWQNLNGLGDASWTAGDPGNPKIALMWRSPGLAVLTGFSDPLPTGQTYQYGITLNNDYTFDGPLFLQFIQTLKNEAPYPLGDAVMLVHLPLQYRSGGNLINVPGPLGQPNPGGRPVLIRTTQFAANPDANTSRFQNWQIEDNNLPASTRGFWVSSGHANPVYYAYTDDGSTRALHKRTGSGTWQQLLTGLLPGSVYGPAFINPYNPNQLYALTTCGVQVSTNSGGSFRGDPVLTALLSESPGLVASQGATAPMKSSPAGTAPWALSLIWRSSGTTPRPSAPPRLLPAYSIIPGTASGVI